MLRSLKRAIIRLIESRGYYVSFGEPAALDSILSGYSRRQKNFFFVQIGAYDGKQSDPIYQWVQQKGWPGLLIEPQTEAFQKLRETYRGRANLILENVAVSDRTGSLALYRLRKECAALFSGDPGMLSSFDPKHILKHLDREMDPAEALEKVAVPAVTLGSLLLKHAITKIDYLQIDAEGHDYVILQSVDFLKWKPRVIHLEHANLEEIEIARSIQILLDQNYRVLVSRYDLTAFQSRWVYS